MKPVGYRDNRQVFLLTGLPTKPALFFVDSISTTQLSTAHGYSLKYGYRPAISLTTYREFGNPVKDYRFAKTKVPAVATFVLIRMALPQNI